MYQRYKILIIEDNQQLATITKQSFDPSKYQIRIACDGKTGLNEALKNIYDLIILDINLPKIDGFMILKIIRDNCLEVPVIILTQESAIEKLEFGIKCGTDAYISKPFDTREIVARVEGLLLRTPLTKRQNLQIGDLWIDTNSQKVFRGDQEIMLRKKEYQILRYLIINKGKVLSREQILNNVWSNANEPFISTVDVHLSNLRRKVDNNKFQSKLIKTYHGMGYYISED
jgi:DNA-binding response OmpR family regulator